jgi:hypothetical protein
MVLNNKAAVYVEMGECDTAIEVCSSIFEKATAAGRCHVIELDKRRHFIYNPWTKSGLLTLFTYAPTGLFANNVFTPLRSAHQLRGEGQGARQDRRRPPEEGRHTRCTEELRRSAGT